MLAAFPDDIRDRDMIAPHRRADRLRLPLSRLARLAHVNRNTMTARPDSPAVQAKLGEIARIIAPAAEQPAGARPRRWPVTGKRSPASTAASPRAGRSRRI